MSWRDEVVLGNDGAVHQKKEHWLDGLMKGASKTMLVGSGTEDHKVQGLWMKRGVCPICGTEIERSKDDIFFPYCSYKHKRVVERVEEERMREEARQEEALYYARVERQLEIKRENNRRRREKAMRERLELRISDAQNRYDEYSKKAAELPRGSKEKHRASARAREWYKSIVYLRRQLKEWEAQHEGQGTVQGHGSDGTAEDARTGHE
jgi:endogenous inhibitor of DNA gyrase (YacG/DUF329 family)